MDAAFTLPRLMGETGELATTPPLPCSPSGIPQIPRTVTASWRLPVVLRPWQQEALLRWINRCHGSIISATGTGKSFLVVSAIITLKVPTVIIVPTLALSDQWVTVLRSAGIEAGVYSGEQKKPGWVTVALVQSVFDNPEVMREFPFIAIDEGDLLTADDWARALREGEKHPFLLLVSATEPEEDDRRALLNHIAPVLMRISTAEGIRMGLLVPPEILPVEVPLSPKEQEEYDSATERIQRAVRVLGSADPRQVARLTRSPSDTVRNAALGYFAGVNARKTVLQNTQTKPEAVLGIVRQHPGEKVFVFGSLVAPMEALCEFLGANGVRCRTITGSTPTKARRDSLATWGRDFEVLGLVNVGRRGLDIPSASVMVIVGGSTSETAITQTLGRVLRPAPGKTRATIYVVISSGTVEERLLDRVQEVAGQ